MLSVCCRYIVEGVGMWYASMSDDSRHGDGIDDSGQEAASADESFAEVGYNVGNETGRSLCRLISPGSFTVPAAP